MFNAAPRMSFEELLAMTYEVGSTRLEALYILFCGFSGEFYWDEGRLRLRSWYPVDEVRYKAMRQGVKAHFENRKFNIKVVTPSPYCLLMRQPEGDLDTETVDAMLELLDGLETLTEDDMYWQQSERSFDEFREFLQECRVEIARHPKLKRQITLNEVIDVLTYFRDQHGDGPVEIFENHHAAPVTLRPYADELSEEEAEGYRQAGRHADAGKQRWIICDWR